VDNPTLRPGRRGQDQIGAALGQRRFELAAHELGQGHERNQEAVARRMPMPAVVRYAAAGHQAVHMGMVEQLLGPGVQDGEHADGAAHIARVAGQLDDGLGRRLHQQPSTDPRPLRYSPAGVD